MRKVTMEKVLIGKLLMKKVLIRNALFKNSHKRKWLKDCLAAFRFLSLQTLKPTNKSRFTFTGIVSGSIKMIQV